MKLWLFLIAAALLGQQAAAAGLEDAMRASGLSQAPKPSLIAPPSSSPDPETAFGDALWRREEGLADDERQECGGREGCGRQVSALWLAGRQVTAATRAAEQMLVRRYGLRGWARALVQDRDGAAKTGLAAAAGAAMLFADGLHARTIVSGVRLGLDLAALRRLHQEGAELAKVEVGAAGRPLAMTAAWGRRAPKLGLAYRLRY